VIVYYEIKFLEIISIIDKNIYFSAELIDFRGLKLRNFVTKTKAFYGEKFT